MSLRRRARARIGPLTNITRGPEAWSVNVRRSGQLFSGWFADGVWGGRRRGLVAAQRFRDELLLRVEPDTRVRRQVPKGTRSATGVVGVRLDVTAH